jgi:sterol desaturase/sphingolipid hydroxylase (fatty acid hydroxylase superfamily)
MDFALKSPLFTSIALILVAVEIFWRLFVRGGGYDFKGAAASFGVFAGNIAAAIVSGLIIAPVYLWCWSLAPVKLPEDDWRVWAAGFVLVEFAYYWAHRFNHTVRWMWATHSVHHSTSSFSLPAAVRLGWTNVISGGWLVYALLIVAGLPPLVVVTLLAINLRYQFLLHTELVGKLGPLEWIFNTPSHHRVHHSARPEHLDKNFGGVVILFDRLFGTFASERAGAPMRYGLTEPVKSHNPFVIAFHEWAAMAREVWRSRSLAEIGAALFGAPGAWHVMRSQRAAAHSSIFVSGSCKNNGEFL